MEEIKLDRINEIKILHDVHLIHQNKAPALMSNDNLRAEFELTGDVKGNITCFLCIDGHELSSLERNYIFPLFVESMNILIGRQISLDNNFNQLKVKLSAPKLNMISYPVDSTHSAGMEHFNLELEASSFNVFIEYNLKKLN